MRAPDVVLELDGVEKEYPGTPPVRALDGVDLSIHSGEMTALVGPSGSGKSTLMNVIGTLDRPTAGEVRIDGVATTTLSQSQLAGLRAARIGFVFQQFHLLEGASVLDNVASGLIYRGIGRSRRRRSAADALERVGLAHRVDHRPPQLSGGERQRVAIARAIVGEPAIVLADEPTGNLDTATSESIIRLMEGLNATGTTILVITHDRDVARGCRRQVTIRDGRLVTDPSSTQLDLAPLDVAAGDRGGSPPSPATPVSSPRSEATLGEVAAPQALTEGVSGEVSPEATEGALPPLGGETGVTS